jgi:pre-rRNA-processing protein IPI3
MSISITSALLIVGTSTGYVQVYDIASQQLIRSITAHKDFSITDVRTMLKPQDLMGHASLGDPSSFKEPIPIRSIASFQRTRDPKTRENHDVLLIPPAHPAV